MSDDALRRSTKNTCSNCTGPRDRPGQRYCRACHNTYQRAHRKPWESTPKTRARARAKMRKRRAIQKGTFVNQCSECGSDEHLELHHESYEPSVVVPLCRVCHGKVHGKMVTRR